MKKCNECNIEKDEKSFKLRNKKKLIYSNRCKSCAKKYHKEYYLKNKENILATRKKYREDNREILIEKDREYKKNNKEKLKEDNERYKEDNEELIIERNKKYYTDNRDSILEKSKIYNINNRELINEYKRNRYSEDQLFRLSNNIRSSILNYINRKGLNKNKNTIDILGCDFEALMEHLNNNEYGFIFGDVDLDIDHIIPLSSASNLEEIYDLNKFDNLQLLPSYYNRHIKINKEFDITHFENWLYED